MMGGRGVDVDGEEAGAEEGEEEGAEEGADLLKQEAIELILKVEGQCKSYTIPRNLRWCSMQNVLVASLTLLPSFHVATYSSLFHTLSYMGRMI